ncbi:hypothetical protein [Pleionea sp. CnH1-48]|uniref:hypothetical protein n=1 Tax=Pleionea sp. CnH1-48 TaxID=2954494 RepID=UPI0020973F42|nr:hypothetical protein [Pleionea sp. CnH1-48]MCO7227547.1 hypothetical protein [Pleionea sp. CnH1-48]
MEIEIPMKLGLWWSKSHLEDQTGKIVIENDYLYMPERFSECFWILFERLNYTHDYCLHQLICSEHKLEESRLHAKEGPYDEDHYYWEYNVDVIAKCTVLVVMTSFVEWGLKRVLKELAETIPPKTDRGVSDIGHYINYLKTELLSNWEVSPGTLSTLDSLRRLRNKFAHGEWDAVEPLLEELLFKDTFSAVSCLFRTIEESAWESEWGK